MVTFHCQIQPLNKLKHIESYIFTWAVGHCHFDILNLCKFIRICEIMTYVPFKQFPLVIFSLLLKDLSFNFYLLLLQPVLCRVAALKSLPVHHPKCRLYFLFGPVRVARIF